jgi:hypothetical protein
LRNGERSTRHKHIASWSVCTARLCLPTHQHHFSSIQMDAARQLIREPDVSDPRHYRRRVAELGAIYVAIFGLSVLGIPPPRRPFAHRAPRVGRSDRHIFSDGNIRAIKFRAARGAPRPNLPAPGTAPQHPPNQVHPKAASLP